MNVIAQGVALEKRATVNDVATLGYASLNGGTTGGSGGTTVQVSTLAALTTAAASSAKSIIIITGMCTSTIPDKPRV
jgi:pectate lyase